MNTMWSTIKQPMGSLPSPKFPVIDFGKEDLRPGTTSWVSTSNQVVHALEQYGCFEALYNNKLPLQLHNDLFHTIEKFYDLPFDTKNQNTSTISFNGYVANIPEIPLFEALGILDATDPRQIQDFTNAMWPHGSMNDKFSKTLLSYATLVAELEQMVMRMVLESYGVLENEQKLQEDEPKDGTYYLLKMMKYREPKQGEGKLGCYVHTDKYTINVLHENEVSGLDVQTKDGQWVRLDSTPSSFIVMAGESFLAWSNGRIHAPVHRVMVHETKARYSTAMFCGPKGKIEAPEKLVDADHPRLYKPFDIPGLLRYFATEEGQKHKCYTIKGYFDSPDYDGNVI